MEMASITNSQENEKVLDLFNVANCDYVLVGIGNSYTNWHIDSEKNDDHA